MVLVCFILFILTFWVLKKKKSSWFSRATQIFKISALVIYVYETHQRFVTWAFCIAGWIVTSWLSLLPSLFGLSGLRRRERGQMRWRCQRANHVMFAEKKTELCYFFPLLWSGSATAKHTWGKYLSAHWQEECEKCPRPWVCVWVRVLSFLRPAACRRSEVTKPSCSPFRYSLSLHVALTAAWSNPAMFKQISLLSIVVIKLFINHLEFHDTLNQMCWARITKCSLLTSHKNVWLTCLW